jgi:hypothetical protein
MRVAGPGGDFQRIQRVPRVLGEYPEKIVDESSATGRDSRNEVPAWLLRKPDESTSS